MVQHSKEALAAQLVEEMRGFIQSRLEFIMREEIHNFLHVEQPETPDSRNGYYTRMLDTRYGRIENLSVPRDRQGLFQTGVFEPYSRREGWLEEAIIQMYKSGMSTRDVAQFVERIIGSQYSPTTITNITNTVREDIEAWCHRPLRRRYSVLYMDGLYVPLKRDTVAQEIIYVVMGITEEGYRQILGFYVGGTESATIAQEVLRDLQQRGVREVLIGVADGLTGLKEAFLSAFPKADFQRCVVHKLRNTLAHVRATDKTALLASLKGVYSSETYEEALVCFGHFEKKWSRQYPREVASWREDLADLLRFYHYPEMIRDALYTTNAIERTIKEIRKRTRPMNSIANIEAAEKIVYLFSTAYNEVWSKRVIRGFGDAQTGAALAKMYAERYGTS